MMIISDSQGNFLKNLNADQGKVYGLHSRFGLISEEHCQEREKIRAKRGLRNLSNQWGIKFSFKEINGKTIPVTVNDSLVQEIEEGEWLITQNGKSIVVFASEGHDSEIVLPYHPHEEEVDEKIFNLSLLATLLLALGIVFALVTLRETPEEEDKKEEEPITVKVIEPPKAVKIPAQKILKERPKLTEKQKAHRAVKQNLSFLGLVGNQNIKKAIGGATTNLKNSAGAGDGQQGSGGELLVGLGKGVKKTTVGNTGVAGLGGVGTKGRGGGAGGYGTTSIASGEGKGLSTIPISNDMVLDGGLDAYVVQATIAKYLNQVRACYEQGLQKNPGLTGKVTVNFEVSGQGTLNYSRVKSSTLGHPGVEKCITTKMMNWIFPKPRGGVNVPITYPFLLRPVKS